MTAAQRRQLFVVAGPLVALALAAWLPLAEPAAAMAGLAAWMAVWWLSEAVPLPVTALVPLVAMPATQLASAKAVGAAYGHPIIFLFLGGFLLALGLEESGLHRRLSLRVILWTGDRPRLLVLGFFVCTALISMWVNNTATAMLMLPVALSVIGPPPAADDLGEAAAGQRRFAAATLLAVAHGASIGGMGTLVGTAPNMVLVAQMESIFPAAPAISFGGWMAFATPFVALMVVASWALLVGPLLRVPARGLASGSSNLAEELAGLGKLRRDEWQAGGLFALVALGWVFGDDLRLGEDMTIRGWRSLLDLKGVDDGALAIGGALLLFVLPSGDRPGKPLLTWDVSARIPWGLLLLFGGGFALADGFGSSGLSLAMAKALVGLQGAAPALVLAVVVVGLCGLTELTSNTATAALSLPVLAQLGVAMELDPRALMVPATLAASCGFALPVATPPNAIVYGSGRLTVGEMVRVGLALDALSVVLIVAFGVLWGGPTLGIDWQALPGWASPR